MVSANHSNNSPPNPTDPISEGLCSNLIRLREMLSKTKPRTKNIRKDKPVKARDRIRK
jgi:hypothetical protein